MQCTGDITSDANTGNCIIRQKSPTYFSASLTLETTVSINET